MPNYPVPAERLRRERMVSNSRFIASLAPVFSVEEAREFIAQVRAEFPDASHHVPVYRVGFGESVIEHCTDAGEPAGTAGRPALAVLRGSGLGDTAVVVTRYFGGTKLGTGGLVRAYSEAVRLVTGEVARARRLEAHTLMLAIPYASLEQVRRLVAAWRGQVLDSDFGADITLTARLLPQDLAGFQAGLAELTNGAVQAQIIETGMVLVRDP